MNPVDFPTIRRQSGIVEIRQKSRGIAIARPGCHSTVQVRPDTVVRGSSSWRSYALRLSRPNTSFFKPLLDAISRHWPHFLGFGLILLDRLGRRFRHPADIPFASGSAVLWMGHLT